MRFILALLAFSSVVLAYNAEEEALVLNQEMQFLEESSNPIPKAAPLPLEARATRSAPDTDLESTYFDDAEEDTVSARTSAPRRRSAK
jgi:hypothetical protein